MNIVVIDGATLNPGDLSWEALGALGHYEVFPRTTAAETIPRCRDAEAIITNKVALDRSIIAALPRLQYVGVTATGYNIVDTEAAEERGIVVTNVPTYGTESVAQMVFALLLELTQHAGHHSQTVHDGRWATSDNFCYWDYPLVELSGLTLGIVGCGRIGTAVARIGAAFGMKVIAYDTAAATAAAAEPARAQVQAQAQAHITRVDLETVFSQSDVVSLHCPLTPETRGLINAARLSRMKPTAFLINTSRGPLVDEQSLADALNNDRIRGAGVDVLSVEPPKADNPLLSAKNCIVTPHIAWATRAARTRLLETSIANLRAYIAGAPRNAVAGTGKRTP
jgi:glycerate dehydrogenase